MKHEVSTAQRMAFLEAVSRYDIRGFQEMMKLHRGDEAKNAKSIDD